MYSHNQLIIYHNLPQPHNNVLVKSFTPCYTILIALDVQKYIQYTIHVMKSNVMVADNSIELSG